MIEKTFDLTNLTLPKGTCDITVKAKGAGLESDESEVLEYTETRALIQGTPGLSYELTKRAISFGGPTETCYVCSGIGTATETDIVIGNTYNGLPVRGIANEAFLGANITSVAISNGIKYIGSKAFAYCRNTLSRVTIPDSVTSIGDYAFYNCDSLTSVVIPDSVTSIGNNAFCGCSGLTSITIPDSVTKIGGFAFAYSGLTSITIPESVTNIGDAVFTGCSNLSTATLKGGGLTYISRKMFSGCTSLESIELPSGVTSIGAFAFKDCTNLKSVKQYDILSVGKAAFLNCHDDLFFIDSTSVKWLKKVDEDGYKIGHKILLEATDKTRTGYELGGVNVIADSAFEACSNLTEINLPSTLMAIGANAFKNCTSVNFISYGTSKAENWSNIIKGHHFAYGVPVYDIKCVDSGYEEYVPLRSGKTEIIGTINFNEVLTPLNSLEGDAIQVALPFKCTVLGNILYGPKTLYADHIEISKAEVLYLRTLTSGDYEKHTAYDFEEEEWSYFGNRRIEIEKPTSVNNSIYEWLEQNATFLDAEE